jgi:Na+-driven multidrug efflux pump
MGKESFALEPGMELGNMSDPRSSALTAPVVPTFFSYAAASTVGLLAITTMNVVDGAFVGNYVGASALAAIALLIPYFTVVVALALMLAIGGSVTAGMHASGGDEERASSVFTQTLLATAFLSTVLAVLSLAFEEVLLRWLHVPAALAPVVQEYLSIIRWVLIVQLTTMVLYYFVRADDHPFLAAASLVLASLTNIALDAVFVVYLDLGIRGSAYGTALAQLVQIGILWTYFWSGRRSLRFVSLHANLADLFRAAYSGVSEFINEVSGGLLVWLVTDRLLVRMGVDGVAAYGIVNFTLFTSLMLSYGLGDAVHLLVSQNFGAGNRLRIEGITKSAFGCALGLGVCLALSLATLSETVVGWFLSAEDEGVVRSAAALATVLWPVFLVNTSNVVFCCYFTAIQKPTASATVALLRGIVLPGAFLLALDAVQARTSWGAVLPPATPLVALPLAEWVAFGVGLFLYRRHRPRALQVPYALEHEGPGPLLQIS